VGFGVGKNVIFPKYERYSSFASFVFVCFMLGCFRAIVKCYRYRSLHVFKRGREKLMIIIKKRWRNGNLKSKKLKILLFEKILNKKGYKASQANSHFDIFTRHLCFSVEWNLNLKFKSKYKTFFNFQNLLFTSKE